MNKQGRTIGTTGKADTLDKAQLTSLLNAVSVGSYGNRNRTILTLTHYLGLRASEVSNLKIKDIVDNKGKVKAVLKLLASYTKGNKHRDVPLGNTKVKEALKGWIQHRIATDGTTYNAQAPLFQSRAGNAFTANSMTRMIGNLYKDNGHTGCSSHTGRRSMITNLANAGYNLHSIKEIAGHSNIQTTQGYIDSNPVALADIMKSL